MRYQKLTGKRFGRLTVIEYVRTSEKNRSAIWKCKCDCGLVVEVEAKSLKSGNTQSCGCLVKKHGMTNTSLYNIWQHMKWRCYNKKSDRYRYYGGKGVTVYKKWINSFIGS